FSNQMENIEKQSESPFEEAVAKALLSRGYNIRQQWKAGAYRIDIVVFCGKKRVAVECDGDRYHSSSDQITKDMERQTILERIGWRFIRIRGSEFYRNQTLAIDRVVNELTGLDIYPEKQDVKTYDKSVYSLKDRVTCRAHEFLIEWGVIPQNNDNNESDSIDVPAIYPSSASKPLQKIKDSNLTLPF
ncbi:MAG: DUF559 domain-containing protein, partial [Oxalobacter sp.]|nr:DUF559 domain-containing protein [Oxalobacter sp.]